MSDQIFVTVENIKNPSVRRRKTLAAARMTSKEWRIVDGDDIPELKKKEVAVSAVKPRAEQTVKIIPVTEPIIPDGEFAKIGEADEELETLRQQYFEKTGKPADKRMGKDKLKSKIEEA